MIHLIRPVIIYLVICISNLLWIHNKLIEDRPVLVLIGLQLIELAIMNYPWRKNENNNY